MSGWASSHSFDNVDAQSFTFSGWARWFSFSRNVRTSGIRSKPNSLPHSPDGLCLSPSTALTRANAMNPRSKKIWTTV